MQIMYVVLSKFALYPSNYILSVLTCLHSIHSGSKTHITSLKQNNKIAYFFDHLSQPQMTALFMFLSWFCLCLQFDNFIVSTEEDCASDTESSPGREEVDDWLPSSGYQASFGSGTQQSVFLPSFLPACLPPWALCLESVAAVCLSALSGTLP